jgi:phosphosulfolactate phosphohydrolase-like enzyme
VLVEPCYGVVAVAAALDAGWDSVEIAPQGTDLATAPIPLVSFEQPVVGDQAGSRCRVRSDDLANSLDRIVDGAGHVVLAAPANARPAMSAVARASVAARSITFVPAAHALWPDPEPLTSDGMWACGMLIRVLLEELDTERGSTLTDAAGIAVTIAQGAEDVATQLSAGSRWRDHLAAGGHPDDLRVASAVDSLGVVPAVRGGAESRIAHAWLP